MRINEVGFLRREGPCAVVHGSDSIESSALGILGTPAGSSREFGRARGVFFTVHLSVVVYARGMSTLHSVESVCMQSRNHHGDEDGERYWLKLQGGIVLNKSDGLESGEFYAIPIINA